MEDLSMNQSYSAQKKPPAKATESPDPKLLVSRHEAALRLSISDRVIDYLIANKQIAARRIGSRVLIAVTELQRFSRRDHPEAIAS
jgi:excisionase family DNA binding protein